MLILDENVVVEEEAQLHAWRIATKKIGNDVGRSGMKDDEIIPLLHSLRRPIFFTNDFRFFERDDPHPNFCIVVISAGRMEMASLIRRFLKHTEFDTEAKRLGKIVLVTQQKLRMRQLNNSQEVSFDWP